MSDDGLSYHHNSYEHGPPGPVDTPAPLLFVTIDILPHTNMFWKSLFRKLMHFRVFIPRSNIEKREKDTVQLKLLFHTAGFLINFRHGCAI